MIIVVNETAPDPTGREPVCAVRHGSMVCMRWSPEAPPACGACEVCQRPCRYEPGRVDRKAVAATGPCTSWASRMLQCMRHAARPNGAWSRCRRSLLGCVAGSERHGQWQTSEAPPADEGCSDSLRGLIEPPMIVRARVRDPWGQYFWSSNVSVAPRRPQCTAISTPSWGEADHTHENCQHHY